MKVLLLVAIVFGVSAFIEDMDNERKPPRPTTKFPTIVIDTRSSSESLESEESEESGLSDSSSSERNIPVRPAVIFVDRRKRAIHDPVQELLDRQAAEAVFNDLKTGSPNAFPVGNAKPSQVLPSARHEEESGDELPELEIEDKEVFPAAGFLEEKTTTTTAAPFTFPTYTTTTRAPTTRKVYPPVATKAPTTSGYGPASYLTGPNIRKVSSYGPPNTRVVSYDAHVHPDFPKDAPRARGLVNTPNGWNTNRQVDYQFKAGYRWNTAKESEAQFFRRGNSNFYRGNYGYRSQNTYYNQPQQQYYNYQQTYSYPQQYGQYGYQQQQQPYYNSYNSYNQYNQYPGFFWRRY